MYTDPVFGTRIHRVTDSSDGTHCVHGYSIWRAMNADDTRFLIACDGIPLLYRFDPATVTFDEDGRLWGADGARVSFEGAHWSPSDPDILYGLEGTRLWRIDVSRRGQAGYTLVRDFAGTVPYSFAAWQLGMSDDERVFTFHTRGQENGMAVRDAVAFDRVTGQVWVFDRGDYVVDETFVDKSGRWINVMGSFDNEGFLLWDFRTDETVFLSHQVSDERGGGHYDMGRTLLVNSDGWATGITARRYDAPSGAENLHNLVAYRRPNGSLNWTIADHVSLRTDDESFAVVSTYGGDGTYAAFEDEVYLVYTDGSGFVRLAHHRSAMASSDSGWRYWGEPRAVVDRFGRYVIYTSDLGSSSRHDVMLLEIPEELWPDTVNPPPGDFDAGVPGTTDAGMVAEDPPRGGCALGRARVSIASLLPFLALALARLLRKRARIPM